MSAEIDVVEELLGLAKNPEPFSKDDMVEIALVAATEIMKLRRYDTLLKRAPNKRRRQEA